MNTKQAAYEAGVVLALADADLANEWQIKQAYNALYNSPEGLSAEDWNEQNRAGGMGLLAGGGAAIGAGVGGSKLLDALAARNTAGRAADLSHTRSGAKMLGGEMGHLLENVRSGAGGAARGVQKGSTILSRFGGRASQALSRMSPGLRMALAAGGVGAASLGGAQLAGQAAEDAQNA